VTIFSIFHFFQALDGLDNDDVRLFYRYFEELKWQVRKYLSGKARNMAGTTAVAESALMGLFCDVAIQSIPLADVDEYGYPMLWPLLLKYVRLPLPADATQVAWRGTACAPVGLLVQWSPEAPAALSGPAWTALAVAPHRSTAVAPWFPVLACCWPPPSDNRFEMRCLPAPQRGRQCAAVAAWPWWPAEAAGRRSGPAGTALTVAQCRSAAVGPAAARSCPGWQRNRNWIWPAAQCAIQARSKGSQRSRHRARRIVWRRELSTRHPPQPGGFETISSLCMGPQHIYQQAR
jgi:hypothetical protein